MRGRSFISASRTSRSNQNHKKPGLQSLLKAAAAVSGLIAAASHANASTWTNLLGGSWTDPLNWTPDVPNAIGAIGDFSTLNLTADATVSLDTNRTVGQLMFGDTTPSNNWTLGTAAGSVTFQSAVGPGG